MTRNGGSNAFHCRENSVLTSSRISQLAKEMASDGILPEREPFGFANAPGTFLKYSYSIILCTGRTNYVNIWIDDGEKNFAEN